MEAQPTPLNDAQRDDLAEIARSHALPARFLQRAKIVVLLAVDVSPRAVETKLDDTRPTIATWRARFLEHRVEGQTNRHRARPRCNLTVRLRARVLAATHRPPPDGTTPCSCRRLAAHLGVDENIVQRVWREADARPHRLARHTASNAPDFQTKAAHIIGLYLDPEHTNSPLVAEPTADPLKRTHARVVFIQHPRPHAAAVRRVGE